MKQLNRKGAKSEGTALSIKARKRLRAEKSVPALAAVQMWLIQTRAKTANGGGSAKKLFG